MKANTVDPREHVNETPTDDLRDVLNGFNGMLGFMALIFFGMIIIKFIMS